ncbi:MAG: exo-alpha-sialidase, partial [bacterium]|nr:exo-alpha-sialidase [bacterium]
PPVMWRMLDGRLFVLWNNCESPPAHEGAGVYVNRDALHAAVSDDEGKTWRGFREVYRDPLEYETPPHTDHGTAYPTVPVMIDGRVLFLTGQGKGRRNLVSLDPRWLTLTHHEDDFSDGLKDWIAFKTVGPAKRYLRARTHGPQLMDKPTKPDARVLCLGKPDEHPADGALWNFPNGVRGKLTIRVLLNEGFGGGSISLCDRSFKPTDDHSERLAIFTVPMAPDGTLGTEAKLALDTWHTLEFTWALEENACRVSVDGKQA